MHPRIAVDTLRRVVTIARAKAGRWKVRCPVCRNRFRAFLPAGLASRPNARCPSCGALERHRLQWLFLRDRTDLFRRPNRVLHMAPEPCLARHLAGQPGIRYVTADRDWQSGGVCVDITSMAFADDSFDVILCSHVLEHILDDAAAIADMYRVLRPGGWAMLQVPLDDARASTFEDPAVVKPFERERLFGQADHVRVYGRDYPDRLRRAGFQVHADEFAYTLDARLVSRYALLPETIFVCRKTPRA